MKNDRKIRGRKGKIAPSPACFRQRVELAAVQADGLSESELSAALAFEIEPFSGIPAAAGRVAWKRLDSPSPSLAAFDVVQIRLADLDSVPAGTGYVTAIPAAGEALDSLPAIPVAAKRSLRAGGAMKLYLAAAALAIAALAADGIFKSMRASSLRRLVAEREVLEAERVRLASRVSSLAGEASAIRRARADAARAQDDAAALRSAWRALLASLPKACGGESVLAAVAAGENGFTASVRGNALSPAAAARVSTTLTEELRTPKSAWVIRPGRIGAASPGGTVPFECTLEFDPNRSYQ